MTGIISGKRKTDFDERQAEKSVCFFAQKERAIFIKEEKTCRKAGKEQTKKGEI